MPLKFNHPHLLLQLLIDLVHIVKTTVLLCLTISIFQLETFSLLSYHCYQSPLSVVTTTSGFGMYLVINTTLDILINTVVNLIISTVLNLIKSLHF